jgi:hypothetical protein
LACQPSSWSVVAARPEYRQCVLCSRLSFVVGVMVGDYGKLSGAMVNFSALVMRKSG